MNETKFTKGPWSVDAAEETWVTADKDGLMVAETDFMDRPEEEHEANAHLISAAPELYEALSELVRMNERWNADVREIIGRPPSWTDQYLTTARLALKKARGEA